MRSVRGPVVPNDDQTNEKGATMKLTTVTHVSVDGVMQGLGGADEDRRGGFERGRWALPLLGGDVASTTLTDPQWADTTVLSGDLVGELQVHGSGNLVRWLLDNELVDEITLLIYPVVIGQGTRLFPDTCPDTALELVDSRAYPAGDHPGLPARRASAVRIGHVCRV
jgi:hypothetical protein